MKYLGIIVQVPVVFTRENIFHAPFTKKKRVFLSIEATSEIPSYLDKEQQLDKTNAFSSLEIFFS